MKACTVGKRHKWVWQYDHTGKTDPTRLGQFYRIGIYACACGATKRGAAKNPL